MWTRTGKYATTSEKTILFRGYAHNSRGSIVQVCATVLFDACGPNRAGRTVIYYMSKLLENIYMLILCFFSSYSFHQINPEH